MTARIEPLFDAELIASTLRHPQIYRHISDDSCPDPAALTVTLSDSLLYLGAYVADVYHGLFFIHPHNRILHEVHTCLLPSAWGPVAKSAARALVAWVFENTPCLRLITCVPDGNALAMRLARTVGMVQFGHNPASLQRGGVLLGVSMLGISRGATCQ